MVKPGGVVIDVGINRTEAGIVGDVDPGAAEVAAYMPKIDGLEVLAQIKGDPRTRSTPVIIMSSSDQESDMLRSYAAYANSYIVKPIDFKEFTEQVALLGQYWTRINRYGF